MNMSNPEPPFPLSGGCACGAIRYRLETTPLIVHCCHCTACHRETGSAFAINAVIESSMVTHLPPADAMTPASKTQEAKLAGPQLTPPTGTATGIKPGEIVDPELITTPSESGKGQIIARCPRCWVAVWSNYAGAGSLTRFVRVGTLDRAWLVRPDVHIYTRSKRDFVRLDDSVPVFEEFYKREEVWREGSLVRWENLLRTI